MCPHLGRGGAVREKSIRTQLRDGDDDDEDVEDVVDDVMDEEGGRERVPIHRSFRGEEGEDLPPKRRR